MREPPLTGWERAVTLAVVAGYVVHGGPRWLWPMRLGLLATGLAVALPMAVVLKAWEWLRGGQG